jgi:hypothetical protein
MAVISVSQARAIALSMPEAEERAHFGHPDFRVRNKIFATLWPDKGTAVVMITVADQTALLQMHPQAFSLNAWSHYGATNVHLRHVSAVQFRDLVRTAWRKAAPKRLVTEHEGVRPATTVRSPNKDRRTSKKAKRTPAKR